VEEAAVVASLHHLLKAAVQEHLEVKGVEIP
jgi:hypothetical protein